jgi:hypothetical protein
MAGEGFVKIAFELQPDADGYPSDRWETLWASKMPQTDTYRIDNIPFFVKGISSEDIVSAEERDGQLTFVKLIKPSKNSVFRLYVADESKVAEVCDGFKRLGCDSEKSGIPGLIAIEIPGRIPIAPIATLIEEGARSGQWEYEEGVLRHVI